MKQRIKRNSRKKALFGIDDAIIWPIIGSIAASAIGAGASIGGAAMNAETQKRIAEQQQRKQILANNELNAQTALANQTEALNYNQNNEIETAKTDYLSTINSQFRCGGKRRMKKTGGSISANVKGLGRYI